MENQTEASVCILLDGTIDVPVTVDVQLESGSSAQPGVDFLFSSGTVIFQPSANLSSRMCLSVTVVDDETVEALEAFSLTLSSADISTIIIAVGEVLVTILDSTQGPVQFLNSSTVVLEGEDVLLCFNNPLSFERNATLEVIFEPFGSEFVKSRDFIGYMQ